MSEKRKQPNTNNSKITIITEEKIQKIYSSEVPRDYSHNKRKRKSYEKKFKFETVQEYMDSFIIWKRLGSKSDVPHDTIRKWKRQVIKMYQDPSISALNHEGNTILWDWITKHLVMEGDEKTYPEIVAPLKGPYIRRHIIGLLENKKYRSGKATSVSRAAVYRWMNLRGLYCKSIDHVEDRPKSEEDKKRDNTRFFQTYAHYIEENELTSDRIWCMDETMCQHSDTPKKSFKLRNSSSFSKTHGFNQRYTSLVRIISTWYHFNDIGRSTYKAKNDYDHSRKSSFPNKQKSTQIQYWNFSILPRKGYQTPMQIWLFECKDMHLKLLETNSKILLHQKMTKTSNFPKFFCLPQIFSKKT
ncbi:hypothetical protein M0812_16412 [Anaeramoeba flamelloides]|uniref:Transposase n=1 Tax=Anaeramoeba flamelloides TaxID=1746091 RepID=A0AAV7ZEF9_9EUKA|nr:hypothetical protein M0812_16412 [Anaeramoeba flamelloides]